MNPVSTAIDTSIEQRLPAIGASIESTIKLETICKSVTYISPRFVAIPSLPVDFHAGDPAMLAAMHQMEWPLHRCKGRCIRSTSGMQSRAYISAGTAEGRF